MSQASRPPITCHVLDTVAGVPAANIPVTLILLRPELPTEQKFNASTNSDGRVAAWSAGADGVQSLDQIFADARALSKEIKDSGSLLWALSFDVGSYFKGEGFWEVVDIKFKTDIGGATPREHWHVPLLLSPWSYSTYRGS